MAKATTQIKTRAFDCDIEVTLKKPEYMSVVECIKYVKQHIIDTAEVISIIQKRPEGDLFIANELYPKQLSVA